VSQAATPSLVEVTGFGSNPGALKLYAHVPPSLRAGAPLLLVMHGCTQTAADATRYGFDALADANGFVVGYPEQQTANNPLRCFNWAGEYGNPANVTRGQGENLSIKQMVDKLVADNKLDPKRVFVAGFSAGAAEALLAAATWPEVFAGAASIAGIPYNCTTTYAEVSSCQKPGKTFTADAWGDKVRAAHPSFAGPWPKVSVWQGSSDTVVGPANRAQITKQWSNVHGLSETPQVTDTVDGQKREVWKDASGAVVVESYEIAGMDHGVPIMAGCGAAGAYAYDKGICASKRIAELFGLVGAGATPTPSVDGGAGGDSGTKPTGPEGSAGKDAGPTGSANAAAEEEAFGNRNGSTCSMHEGGASSPGAFLAAFGLVVAARSARRRARRQP
jgi:poly(hydroxyalkanoate) depolymerase family esterase